jgi:putative Mg2+ transporter-C (MgtC) family protein
LRAFIATNREYAMGWIQFTLNLAVAFVLGSMIGAERQWRQRMAGLRTNALVATGAAMFVMLAAPVSDNSLRVAAQVVSGIGFLGAGVIMREGLTVRGLNTAATLWCSAAVGTLSGSGQMKLAMIGAAGVLLANFGLRPLARLIDRQPSEPDVTTDACYTLRLVCHSRAENHARALLLHMTQTLPLTLQSLHSEDLNSTEKVEVRAEFHSPRRQDATLEEVVGRMSLEPEISAVSWQVCSSSDSGVE